MKNQKGFTLIELVVVIVILGILAVTAAPRFLNLQSDARASSLQGLKGAMAGAGSIVYGKSAIEGQERSESGAVPTGIAGGDDIITVYGYPAADESGIGRAVEGLTTGDDWVVDTTQGSAGTGTGDEIVYRFADSSDGTSCVVSYTAPSVEGGVPTISAADASGC
ncbi:type II secretion system protein [Vibrio ulleungensis]|uniref:Type II secretion system protein n=1 Tax=Vibrio ulleungensis TaxID=2807619 RepID=A0ABS2HKJ9_9VIBR|nr:type II secretion system protein [Vibrio ulleungensis]MBM7038028.1 type II secretion system protein [Vibrio ulleungensis]